MKPPKHLNVREFLATLERTPRLMLEVNEGFTNQQLRLKPAKDSWSMLDVLWHLRGCDAVWVESIEKMLLEKTPTIAYQHPNDWWKLNLVKTAEYFEILEQFRLIRIPFNSLKCGFYFNELNCTKCIGNIRFPVIPGGLSLREL